MRDDGSRQERRLDRPRALELESRIRSRIWPPSDRSAQTLEQRRQLAANAKTSANDEKISTIISSGINTMAAPSLAIVVCPFDTGPRARSSILRSSCSDAEMVSISCVVVLVATNIQGSQNDHCTMSCLTLRMFTPPQGSPLFLKKVIPELIVAVLITRGFELARRGC